MHSVSSLTLFLMLTITPRSSERVKDQLDRHFRMCSTLFCLKISAFFTKEKDVRRLSRLTLGVSIKFKVSLEDD